MLDGALKTHERSLVHVGSLSVGDEDGFGVDELQGLLLQMLRPQSVSEKGVLDVCDCLLSYVRLLHNSTEFMNAKFLQ